LFLLVVIFVFHQFLDFKMFSTSVKVVDVDLQVTVAQCQAFSSMTRASLGEGDVEGGELLSQSRK